ncbi:MAG: leucyl/phenylalanyl-tRNA--protein transferase [Burkholderiaceae bacterium]
MPGSRAGERLVAGLYGVAIGRMFFGESMFTRVDDGSKIALAGLVAALRQAGFSVIDCQQSTRHLRSLGAVEIPRVRFLTILRSLAMQPDADWDALQIDLPDA